MISHKFIDDYFGRYERGEILFNKERQLLYDYLKNDFLLRNDIYIDSQMVEDYVTFSEKYFFPLDEWEKFITPFIFCYYKKTNDLVFEKFFITMGRGGGKNGFITTLSLFLISRLHGIRLYDVTIVANSEYQAQRSFLEAHYKIDEKPVLQKYFLNGKAKIQDKNLKGTFRFATSNAKTKDGGREGAVIYDEIHEMVDDAIVDVFSGGLGKVDNPREFFISTNGFVRDGYYDKIFAKSISFLKGEGQENIFPFICKIDESDEVDNFDKWEKANPVFAKPMNRRSTRLFNKRVNDYYEMIETPSKRKNFMNKHMNFPELDLEKDVTSREKLLATQREPSESLAGRSCVAGFDFAGIRDFASVGLLFKIGDDYVWKQHSFARREIIQKFNIKAPLKEWENEGIVTIVDEPSISASLVVNKLIEWRNEGYQIEVVCADSHKMDYLKLLLEEAGFEFEFLRNPGAIQAKMSPIVEDNFENERFIFGNDRMMLWYTDNTFVKRDKAGNVRYEKKEQVRRKTDGFHALLAALYKRDRIEEGSATAFLDALDGWDF
ncbi:putative phage terminase, large subunit [Streptococcus varani]|uniref:Putative phage terminase, large subunit n=1 Tax=Streptococcus varani TaxID=1608583 RepID=A0A0E4H7L3_9STRE|nr:terminase TerL endonuclease subunit [Streptococcus varani]CQR24587.1 putative phage terminase, large subunit [Streptococcus varani]